MNKIAYLILFLSTAMMSCKKNPDNTTDLPMDLPVFEPFKGVSVFYDSIPGNAEVDPNSATMVGSLVDEAAKGFVMSVKEWTVPVYFVDASTPLSDVSLTVSWAPKKKLLQVPVPDHLIPDPEGDGQAVIVDEQGGCIYDFWQMRCVRGKWKAHWGNALPLNGDGIFEKGLSARGSGFELLQGVVWPAELTAGEINHALVFSYDHTKAGGPVAPATESDGTSSDAWAIPEGARVQLDPALDLNALGLNSYEMTIARALQKFGMFCGDDGGGLQLYAVNPICVQNNPYADIWGDQVSVDMSKIPADQFRVLKMGVQNANVDPVIVSNSCAFFE